MNALRPLLLLFVLVGLGREADAESFPDRAIHLVVPFPPGGPVGVVAEVIGPQLAERLGQQVIIEHRSGVDGIVGSDFVAKAPPDGYTLLLASSSLVIHPGTYNVLPFDAETAFVPVSLLVAAARRGPKPGPCRSRSAHHCRPPTWLLRDVLVRYSGAGRHPGIGDQAAKCRTRSDRSRAGNHKALCRHRRRRNRWPAVDLRVADPGRDPAMAARGEGS